MADLKLAVTEAANDFVDESTPDDEEEARVDFDFRLHYDRLVLELKGPPATQAPSEQELSRAIIEATVDESTFEPGPHGPGEADLMLQPIAVGHKSLADYTHVAGKPLIEEIRELSSELEGLKVLHLSATAFGGGVSEILYTLVPLMNDVGIDAEWQVMLGREEFYNVTKLLHNALQGNPQGLSPEEWQIFAKYNEINAEEVAGGWDASIVHDPQPAAIQQLVPEKASNWVWRCHIDLSTPNETAIERLVPLVRSYDGAVFHLQDYVPSGHGRHAGAHLPAGDRPAVAQEHGLLARGRRVRVRPVRHRRGPPAAVPGVALRPVEGPDGRDRRLPPGQGGGPRGAAGADRFDGHRRPRGLGVLQRDDGPRGRRPRRAHPQQPEQRRARSRSTRSSHRPTW